MLLPRLAIVLMKGAFVLGTVLGVRLVLRNRMDAASRYQLVLLALIGLPLLAAIEVLEPGIPPPDSPAVSVAADLSAAPGEPDSAPPIVKPDRPRFKVPKAAADMAIVLWLSVGSMLALRALGSRFATARRIRLLPLCRDPRWTVPFAAAISRNDLRGEVRLLECREGPPFAAGLLRPVVVVPKFGTWSEADREAALIHETAHLKRRDTQGMALAELTAAVFWCVPFMGAAIRALDEDREEACDALALRSGMPPADYAALILEVAAGGRDSYSRGTACMLGKTKLERRIRSIVDEGATRSGRRKLGKWPAVCIAAAVALAAGAAGSPSVLAVENPGPAAVRIRALGEDGDPRLEEYPRSSLPLVPPLEGAWRVTQPFGRHAHPIDGRIYRHPGIDLSNGSVGAPVRCTIDGTVAAAGYDAEKGNFVAVSDGERVVRFFKLDALNVAAEDRVSVGDVIGTVGRTGIATGPHLHYEIWVRGMALDPAAILKAGGVDYEGL